MRDLLTFVVSGLAGGSTYALLALGLVLVHNSSRILNAAQGEIGAFATFLVAGLAISHDWPWPIAVVLGIAAGGLLSLMTAGVLLRRSSGGRLPPLVGTIALLSLLVIVEARYLGAARDFPSPLTGSGITVGGLVLTPTRLLVIGTVAVTSAVMWALIERTPLGLAIRASADNRVAATVVGLDPKRVELLTWLLAGFLGAIAGILLGWNNQSISPGFLTVALPQAFTAAILGGMTSAPGAIVGGLAIGVIESLTRKYLGSTPGSPEAIVFAILFVVLLVRPQGIFSRKARRLATEGNESLVSLDHLVAIPRPPRLSQRTLGAVPLTVTLVAAVAAAGLIGEQDAYKLAILPIFAILALSLNGLIATTGQVSLGHVGLFGLGSFGTAVAATTWGMPVHLALLAGPVLGALVALVLGIAALRVGGLYLTVLTLAFTVMLGAYIFPMPAFSRGGAGIAVSRGSLAGLDLTDESVFLAFTIVALGIIWIADRRALGSPFGRAAIALRENEVAAAARGVHAPVIKVLAFMLSGAGAGLAGALFAYRQGIVVSSAFPLSMTFSLVLYVVLGGLGSRPGVVIITGLFTWTTFYGSSGSSDFLVLGGAGLVVLTIGRYPKGLGGLIRLLSSRIITRRADRAGHTGEVAHVAAVPVPSGPVASADAGAVNHRRLIVRLPDGATMEPSLLGARELSISFGSLPALADVSLDVGPAEIVGVIGPNGAGKTTLFNLLSGFSTPDHGEVWFAGHRVDHLSAASRAEWGMGRTFQQGGLWLSETVLGNLLMAQHLHVRPASVIGFIAVGANQWTLEWRRRQVAEQVLDILGLTNLRDQPVSTLSYGTRKLLELGCALVTRPRILLLDEPAAGMSEDEVAWLAGVIGGIRRELDVAVLVIEHHVPLVRQVADRVYVLNFGHVLASGTPDEVTNNPEVIEAYLGTQGTAADRSVVAGTP
ncbi:MAG: ATP-binding cassette domain-containing protein [Acidimicrobiales bacterium]